ncbi:MAG: imidazole glycerol phosphate synthase subunit HisH [Lawsonibacter sp.]
MIAVIDYGVGNLFSLKSSLSAIGQEAVVTRDQEELDRADHILLPGVGAFGDAVEKLRSTGMDRAVLRQAAAGKPLLGICLGMQLLFETSFEYGEHQGLGLISGQVRDIGTVLPSGLAIPPHGLERPALSRGAAPQPHLPGPGGGDPRLLRPFLRGL